ncbi:MAG: hypothetical protein MJZ67_08040 [Bacteroidales bacterium]|nr:hypothetical protein [Bacteroidales bacterium]
MKSDDAVFTAVLQMLLPQVVEAMGREYELEATEALRELYCSRLYADLEREDTKLWHLSPLALAYIWHEEKSTGRIIYPVEA